MLGAGIPHVLETGPLLISGFLNWGLLGIIVTQMYTYMQWYYNTDGKLVRVLDISLFVMLVLEWGNPLIFINTPWTMVAIPIQCGIVASMVQIFFARLVFVSSPLEFRTIESTRRIWLLGKGRIMRCITVLVVTLSLIQCASALALTLPLLHATFILTATVLSAQQQRSGAVGEVQMAYFEFSKSKTDFLAATNTLLDRLIMRTIQRGVITAAVAALHIVMVLKYPNIFLDLPPVYTVGKLYANIVFANLNGRKRQMQPLEIETSGISLEFRHRRNLAQSCTTGRDESTVGIHSTNVHITTEIEDSDDYLKKPTLRM
ncbi:hypothetical protein B0H13DRAFT_2365519 [Mycena leptocephala]|nr:hypothetical protein B0H13DRAFT_2365519 [Mycena leptocephala]